MSNDSSTDSGAPAGPAASNEGVVAESPDVGVGRCPVCAQPERSLRRNLRRDDVAVCRRCFSEYIATKLDGNGIVCREPHFELELIVRSRVGTERLLRKYLSNPVEEEQLYAEDSWMELYDDFKKACDYLMSTP